MPRSCQQGMVSNRVASPCRSPEPLDPEGPSPPVLSTFLPPIPSTSLDPPEHFPLRKTGKLSRIKLSPAHGDTLAGDGWSQEGGWPGPMEPVWLCPVISGTGTNQLVCSQPLSPT